MTNEELIDELSTTNRNAAKAELLRRLAASQPGEPGKARCPKCGAKVQFLLLSSTAAGIAAVCDNDHRFPLHNGVNDCWEFFRPSAPSPQLPTVEELARRAWEKRQEMFKCYDSWAEVGAADKQVYLEAATRYREVFQEFMRVAPSGSAGPELSKSEARGLAAGLIDYAEGRVKSFADVKAEVGSNYSDNVLQFSMPKRLMAEMRLAITAGDVTKITELYYRMWPGELAQNQQLVSGAPKNEIPTPPTPSAEPSAEAKGPTPVHMPPRGVTTGTHKRLEDTQCLSPERNEESASQDTGREPLQPVVTRSGPAAPAVVSASSGPELQDETLEHINAIIKGIDRYVGQHTNFPWPSLEYLRTWAGAASHNGQGWEAKLRNLVAAKEPNGYPLWFNRAVHTCKVCDSEDMCQSHLRIADNDFVGCEELIAQFISTLPAPPSEANVPEKENNNEV